MGARAGQGGERREEAKTIEPRGSQRLRPTQRDEHCAAVAPCAGRDFVLGVPDAKLHALLVKLGNKGLVARHGVAVRGLAEHVAVRLEHLVLRRIAFRVDKVLGKAEAQTVRRRRMGGM